MTQAVQVTEFPTTFIVDGEGCVFRRHVGDLDEGKIVRIVRETGRG